MPAADHDRHHTDEHSRRGNPDTGLTIDDDPEAEAWLPQIAPEVGNVAIYHVGPAGLLGSDVADAIPGFQGRGRRRAAGSSNWT